MQNMNDEKKHLRRQLLNDVLDNLPGVVFRIINDGDWTFEYAGWVFNIQKFSLHDGPGIRDLIFMKRDVVDKLYKLEFNGL